MSTEWIWGRTLDPRLAQAAEYSWKKWMESGMVQRWLQLQSEGVAAAAEARLAAGIAHLRMSSMIVGAGGLFLTLVVPLGVWVGGFVALGAGYAEARNLVRNENFESGFSQGFVTGLLKWEWHQAVSRFGKFSPGQKNPFDESLGYIAANAYNDGLRSGYTHAVFFDDATRKKLLSQLKSHAPHAAAGQWTRLDQISYVIDLASAGRRTGVFRAA